MTPLERGFEKLLTYQGEDVTFRGSTIPALVNRSPKRPAWNGPAKTGAPVAVIIQIRNSVTLPVIGNSFTDDRNLTHRITNVKHMGHCWECECSSHPTT